MQQSRFELETSAQPTRDLSLAFNVTYLQTRYDSYSAPALGTVPAYSYTGNQFPGQPKLQYFASATWAIPVSSYGTLKIGASGNFETSYYSDALNTAQYRIPAHGFANAFVAFETNDHHWDFTLTARNLANAFYFTTLTPVGAGIKSGAYAGTLLLEGAQNPPRTVFFKVSYRY